MPRSIGRQFGKKGFAISYSCMTIKDPFVTSKTQLTEITTQWFYNLQVVIILQAGGRVDRTCI